MNSIAQEIEETWYERICLFSPSEPLIRMLAYPILLFPLLTTSPELYQGISTRGLLACGALGAYALITEEAWREWVEERAGQSVVKRRVLVVRIIGFFSIDFLLGAAILILYALWLGLFDPPIISIVMSIIANVGYVAAVILTLLFAHPLNKKKVINRFMPIKRFSAEHRRLWKYTWPVSVVWGLLTIIGWALGLGTLDFFLRLGAEIGLLVGGLLWTAVSMGFLYQFGVLAWAGISDALKQNDM
jgi:hypothetical protein